MGGMRRAELVIPSASLHLSQDPGIVSPAIPLSVRRLSRDPLSRATPSLGGIRRQDPVSHHVLWVIPSSSPRHLTRVIPLSRQYGPLRPTTPPVQGHPLSLRYEETMPPVQGHPLSGQYGPLLPTTPPVQGHPLSGRYEEAKFRLTGHPLRPLDPGLVFPSHPLRCDPL